MLNYNIIFGVFIVLIVALVGWIIYRRTEYQGLLDRNLDLATEGTKLENSNEKQKKDMQDLRQQIKDQFEELERAHKKFKEFSRIQMEMELLTRMVDNFLEMPTSNFFKPYNELPDGRYFFWGSYNEHAYIQDEKKFYFLKIDCDLSQHLAIGQPFIKKGSELYLDEPFYSNRNNHALSIVSA